MRIKNNNIDFMSTLSSLRVSCDPNTIPMLTFYLRIYCRTLGILGYK